MKDKSYLLNTLLAGVLGLALLACAAVRAFLPALILPRLNIPNMTLVSLAVLLLDDILAPRAGRRYVRIAALSAVSFGLLPWAAGLAEPGQVWKLAIVGCAVFTGNTWLFTSIRERLSSGPNARGALILSALGLYLACQCFAGMVL